MLILSESSPSGASVHLLYRIRVNWYQVFDLYSFSRTCNFSKLGDKLFPTPLILVYARPLNRVYSCAEGRYNIPGFGLCLFELNFNRDFCLSLTKVLSRVEVVATLSEKGYWRR